MYIGKTKVSWIMVDNDPTLLLEGPDAEETYTAVTHVQNGERTINKKRLPKPPRYMLIKMDARRTVRIRINGEVQ